MLDRLTIKLCNVLTHVTDRYVPLKRPIKRKISDLSGPVPSSAKAIAGFVNKFLQILQVGTQSAQNRKTW